MSERYLAPIGRFVQGDLFVQQTKDQSGALRVIKTGPNAGQPAPTYFAAVAYAKNDPAWPAFKATIDRVARAEWPALFPVPGGPCTHPQFSDKIIDGDGRDTSGQLWSTREGFAGHWIVRFSCNFSPKRYMVNHYGPGEEVTDPNQIPRGSYIRMAGTINGNKNPQKPGVYVNFDMVEWAGYGAPIISGPDAAATFGAVAAVLPPGASAVPVSAAPAAPLPPGGAPAAPLPPTPGVVAPAAPPLPPGPGTAAPARVMLPPAGGATYEQMIAAGWTDATMIAGGMMQAPTAPVAPYDGYMAAPAAPPAPPAPPAAPAAPPAAPVRTMLPAAGGATYDQMLAAGWNDATLVAHGMMAA